MTVGVALSSAEDAFTVLPQDLEVTNSLTADPKKFVQLGPRWKLAIAVALQDGCQLSVQSYHCQGQWVSVRCTVKDMPIGNNALLSFSGELREQFESYSSPGLGLLGHKLGQFLLHGRGFAHRIKDLAGIEHSPPPKAGVGSSNVVRSATSPSVHFQCPGTRRERERPSGPPCSPS
jgi:hypothetical protein